MKRTITETLCDNCGKSDIFDKIEIEKEYGKRYIEEICVDDRERYLCSDCYNQDVYLCNACDGFHNDENLCEGQIAELAELESEMNQYN